MRPFGYFAALALWASMLLTCGEAVSGVRITERGRPAAVVVIADNSCPVAKYAAQELVLHLEKASGARLEIVRESDAPRVPPVRIYVGSTEAAARAGIDVSGLSSEDAVIRTGRNVLYIAGRYGGDDPLDELNPDSGTLWGVYEFLERELGVRWLWPGKLGTYVPERSSIRTGRIDEVVRPAFVRRRVRNGFLRFEDIEPPLGFSASGQREYAAAQQVFLRRHRMGTSGGHFEHKVEGVAGRRPYVHAFERWWDLYGEDHPEWFQLVDGRRGPAAGGRGTSMCVSNSEFHAEIVELWREAREREAIETPRLTQSGPMHVNICENDVLALCSCERCRSWDAPQPGPEEIPAGLRGAYRPFNASDRYARFAAEIYRLASEIEPEARIYMYAYVNYFAAPSPDIKLNPNIIVGFCPWSLNDGWFPRQDETQQWIKEQWLGWAESGVSLFYRPNWHLTGYAMPHIFARQHAEIFRFMAENNMIGTDYDSLTGQWSVQGTNLYSLMRLHTRPDTPVEEILEEYYGAFGPAAEHVERYFDYWEEYCHRLFVVEGRRVPAHGASYIRDIREFPPEAFLPAVRMLDSAAAAVEGDKNPEYSGRVRFLRKGLEHAKLCARFAALHGDYEYYLSEARMLAGECPRRAVIEDLSRFRREMEDEELWIANFHSCARHESATISRVSEVIVPEDVILDSWDDWKFHKDPEARGFAEGWYSTVFDDGDWQEIEVPAFWVNTRVGGYLGYGWYRTTFDIPAGKEGHALMLRFKGVDEQGWIFVNGELVGEHTVASEQLTTGQLWNRPFTIRVAPENLIPGGKNLLAVLVHASAANAGIWRAVLPWFEKEN